MILDAEASRAFFTSPETAAFSEVSVDEDLILSITSSGRDLIDMTGTATCFQGSARMGSLLTMQEKIQ
jgi:hypothetical protein